MLAVQRSGVAGIHIYLYHSLLAAVLNTDNCLVIGKETVLFCRRFNGIVIFSGSGNDTAWFFWKRRGWKQHHMLGSTHPPVGLILIAEIDLVPVKITAGIITGLNQLLDILGL